MSEPDNKEERILARSFEKAGFTDDADDLEQVKKSSVLIMLLDERAVSVRMLEELQLAYNLKKPLVLIYQKDLASSVSFVSLKDAYPWARVYSYNHKSELEGIGRTVKKLAEDGKL